MRGFAAVLVACLLAGCGGDSGGQAGGTPEVTVVTLTPQSVDLETELAGRTAAYQVSEVRPQVSGIVRKLAFTQGAYVRAGQLLYVLDDASYVATAEQAAASLQSAQANLVAARLKAERYEALAKTNAVSRQEADDATAAYGQAAASVEQAKAQLKAARIDVGYTRVTAPISGRVGRSSVTEGALVTASQTEALATIQRLDPIYVDISQASTDLLRLRRQMASNGLQAGTAPVRLVLQDGSKYAQGGTLQFAEQAVDEQTGTVTLRAVFRNGDGLLLPGMYVRAVVTGGVVRDAILAPQQGISRSARGAATAMVVNSQGKAEQREVVADRTVGDKWLITSGLKGGDRLIVEGLQKVQPGQAVRVTTAGAKAGAAASATQAKR